MSTNDTPQSTDAATSRAVAEDARQKQWRKPSFMKSLFLGKFTPDLLAPYPVPEGKERAEYTEFKKRFKEYLLNEIDPLEIDATGEFPDNTIERLSELGALGMNIPKDYEGLGFTKLEYCKTMQLFASYEGSLMGFLSPHQSVGVPECLKLFGTEEQKRKYLPLCTQGHVSAFALTENEVGSDPARLETSLTRTEDGKAFLLNGEKLWCTNGLCAKLLVVMARHADTNKISAIVVECDWEGVEVAHRCHFMGLSALQNAVMKFKDVRIPAENIIGSEGAGLRIALTALNTGRLSIPYGVLGAAKKAFEVSSTWCKERIQWGVALGEHQAIGHKLGSMATTLFGMESVIELTCALADEGKLDLRLESAAAKEWNTSRAWDIIDDAMQIRGGRGYEKESSLKARGERPMPVERIMRDQRVSRIFEGASEIMHLMMAREAVDKHLEVAGAFIDPKTTLSQKLTALPGMAAFYALWYPKTWLTLQGYMGYGEMGNLAPHFRFIHRASKKLARQAFHGMLIHQAGLEHKQAFLFRWVDIAMELYIMTAACLRAKAFEERGDTNASEAQELAHNLCQTSRKKVDTLFRELWNHADQALDDSASAVMKGKYSWLLDDIISMEECEAAEAIKEEATKPQEGVA